MVRRSPVPQKKIATESPARKVAFEVLLLVEAGGYASDLLRTRCEQTDARDARLASQIVFGCLRYKAQLDFLIGHYSGRPPQKFDAEVLISLRMGIFQMRYLDRIPASAAVSQSVELILRSRRHYAAGVVNAVLRKVDRSPVQWPDAPTELSMPQWLLDRWARQYGAATARAIAEASLNQPETYIRIPPGQTLGKVKAEATRVRGCFRLTGGDPGGFRIQDIGSQAVVPLLDLRPGMTFLDVCAAPGNKTAQALEYGVRTVACDLHLSRLLDMKSLGCPLVALDARRPWPFRSRFDRILLDVPCSGTGTLARNPEIRWRLKPGDLADLHQRQAKLLANAREMLAPGGRLVYATCSLEREENEAVIEEVLGSAPPPSLRRVPGIDAGDGFFAAVIRST
jgi:16S rRNA (cytosine967-C5)-methyltransferase